MTGRSSSLEKIGRYEITGELGKGAMGIVYKAVDPNIGRIVALKTTRVDLHGVDTPEMIRRFQNEARAAGVLNHRNIVTIYDAGESEGVFYIAMEYIEGTTLQELLAKRRSLPIDQIISIGNQICAGLDYAHKKKVVHRDIKPANIMITFDGTVKIMDFGIAKGETSGFTNAGEVVGTPNYMSPEQVRGHDIDGRSDLFSTGVILYEMATGEKPFAGAQVTSIIYKIVNEKPIPPREVDVSIHPGLSAVILKALAKDPEDRYQTGDDLAVALRSYKLVASASEPTVAMKTPPPPRPRPVLHTPTIAIPAPRQAPIGLKNRPSSGVTKPTNGPAKNPAALAKEARTGHHASAKSSSRLILYCVLAIVLAGTAGAIRGRYFGKKLISAVAPQVSAAVNNTPAPKPVEPAPAETAPPADPIARVAAQLQQEDRKQALAERRQALAAKANSDAPAVGTLHITSTPPGATVEVDGYSQSWYVTPFTTPDLKAGEHTLTFHADGFGNQTRTALVVAGKKSDVDVQLFALDSTYNVNSTPAGAAIFLDGTNTGKRTPAQLSVAAGQHKIALALDGYNRFQMSADAGPGQTLNITQQLKLQASNDNAAVADLSQEDQGGGWGRMRRLFGGGESIPAGKGAVVIRTRPKGVTIIVDGFTVRRTTPFRSPIRPGSYNITLQKDGYQSISRVVKVTEGQVSEVDETLQPKTQP